MKASERLLLTAFLVLLLFGGAVILWDLYRDRKETLVTEQEQLELDLVEIEALMEDQEKWTAVNQLPRLLDVSISPDTFAGLHLTWDQVRTMTATGIEMGAHTQSHPILTRVSLAQARQELEGSKNRIEAEINQPVKLFAYPNGLSTDFNADLQTILAQLNFAAAFTLLPGPTQPAEAQQKPLAIRRICLHHQDTLPRFAAKVMGLPRLLKPSG